MRGLILGLAVGLAVLLTAQPLPAAAQQETSYLDNIGRMRIACLRVGETLPSSSIEDASQRLAKVASCVTYAAAATFFVAAILKDAGCSNYADVGTASPGAVIQAFLNWSAKNPGRWNDVPATGFLDAIIEAWGCEQETPGN